MLYSIVITAYECNGLGPQFIRENIEAIVSQTYRPIQCVISDHSKNSEIQLVIQSIDSNGVEIIYTRYMENYGNPCHNWNNALRYATGEYIQYLAMDDRLANPTSVGSIVNVLNQSNPKWLACAHYLGNEIFIPEWNPNILTGNTISGPSAIVLHKSLKHIQLDPSFTWYLDTDWYYRLYKEAGKPSSLPIPTWINRVHPHQLSHTVCTNERRQEEYQRLLDKYGNPLPLAE